MKDLVARREKLSAEVEDCELIAKLAADQNKRETFKRIASQLKELVADLDAEIHRASADASTLAGPDVSGVRRELAGKT